MSKESFRETIAKDNEWNESVSYLQFMKFIIHKQTSIEMSTLLSTSSLITMTPPVTIRSVEDATGEGILLNQQGDIYRGAICKGVPSGKGILTYANGCSLHGIWDHGKLVGDGEYHYNEDVWIPRVGNEVYSEPSLYLMSEIYSNDKKLFDTQKGVFPFAFEESFHLGIRMRIV